MPTLEAKSPVGALKTCPLCAAPLDSANPGACTKCDWVAGAKPHDNTRDIIAVFLSVLPGLGHIYKGHRLTGVLFMIGSVFAAFAIGVAATFTAGWGLLLLPLYWAGVMLQVYWLEDLVLKAHAKQ